MRRQTVSLQSNPEALANGQLAAESLLYLQCQPVLGGFDQMVAETSNVDSFGHDACW